MQYENYHIAIGQVLRFFSREAGGYIFASAADQRLIRSFNESLMARAGEDGQKISLLFLRSDADEPVMEQIRRAAAQAQGLIIGNLDELIHETGGDILLHLNFSREPLQALRTPILFWIAPAHFPLLAKRAADLFSQRALPSFAIAAESPAKRTPPIGDTLSEFGYSPDDEDLNLRIKWLKRQLENAEKEGMPAERIANNLALPLAKAYLERKSPKRSLALFNRYGKHATPSLRNLLEMGRAHQQAGQIVEALELYEAARNANGQTPSLIQASLYDQTAAAFLALPAYEEAADWAQKAIALKRELLKPDSPELITSYRLLADAQSELGQIAEAESAERNALALVKQQEATPGPETASAYHRLARLYLAKGALESALEYQHKALAIYQGLPKRYRAEQAASLSNAAYIYEQMGDIEQALHYQGQAVSILQAACPSDHQGLAAAQQAWQRMNEQLPT